MRYHYEPGAVRWFRHDGNGDVRAHRPTKGWDARAELIVRHPLTGRPLPGSQWWIREAYGGDASSPRDLLELALRCLREEEYPALRERIRQALDD